MAAVHDWKKSKTSQNTIQNKSYIIMPNDNDRFTKIILRNLKDVEILKVLGLAQIPVTTHEMMKIIGTSYSNIYRKVQVLTDSIMLVKTEFHQDSTNNNSNDGHSWEYVRSFESIFVRYNCKKKKDDGICYVSPSIIIVLDRKNYYKIHRYIRDKEGDVI